MSKRNHYVEILYACTKYVAEKKWGERPVAVTSTRYDGIWYYNGVRMADGRRREVCFPRITFNNFVRMLKGRDDD